VLRAASRLLDTKVPGSASELVAACGPDPDDDEDVSDGNGTGTATEPRAPTSAAPSDEGQPAQTQPVACPSAKDRGFVDASPACFARCPQLCAPAEEVFGQVSAGVHPAAIEAMICSNREAFRCLFEDSNVAACRPLLEASSAFDADMPRSEAQLDASCGDHRRHDVGGSVAVGESAAHTEQEEGVYRDMVSAPPTDAARRADFGGVIALVVMAWSAM